MRRFFLFAALLIPVFMPLESFIEKPVQQEIQADTICFARDILPIFNSNCAQAGCHDAASHKESYNLTTYSGVMRGIKSGSPSTSSCYRQIDLRTMPQYPYLSVPDSFKTRIATWITAGAKNTTCGPEASCDTVNIDYLRDIKPIIQLNCVGCHQSSLAGGGVHLDNDETNDLLKENIYNTVAHIAGSAMPKNIAALSTCQIAKIKAWAFPEAPSAVTEESVLRSDIKVISSNSGSDIVRFQLVQGSAVSISVFSADGHEVMSLPTSQYDAGVHDVSFNSSNLSLGLYVIRLSVGDRMRAVKFIR